jgi:hypothetical protein
MRAKLSRKLVTANLIDLIYREWLGILGVLSAGREEHRDGDRDGESATA